MKTVKFNDTPSIHVLIDYSPVSLEGHIAEENNLRTSLKKIANTGDHQHFTERKNVSRQKTALTEKDNHSCKMKMRLAYLITGVAAALLIGKGIYDAITQAE